MVREPLRTYYFSNHIVFSRRSLPYIANTQPGPPPSSARAVCHDLIIKRYTRGKETACVPVPASLPVLAQAGTMAW